MTEPLLAPAAPTPPTPAGDDVRRPAKLFTKKIVWQATKESFVKLDPRAPDPQSGDVRRRAGSAIATDDRLRRSFRGDGRHALVHRLVSVWLWFTVLFANFAEAMAEGRGKAQADTLRAHPHRDARPRARRDRRERQPRNGSRAAPSCRGRHRAGRGRRLHSRATAKWSKASPRWTSRRSPANRRPVIRESGGDRSRRHRRHAACCPTGSSSGSRPNPARRFSTA